MKQSVANANKLTSVIFVYFIHLLILYLHDIFFFVQRLKVSVKPTKYIQEHIARRRAEAETNKNTEKSTKITTDNTTLKDYTALKPHTDKTV